MNRLFAFIKRDIRIGLSYKLNFLMNMAGMGLGLLMFFFMSKAFNGAGFIAKYGGDYFPYVLIGIGVSNFVTVGLNSLSEQVRSAQVEGTLEALLSTPTSIYTILIGNSLSTLLTAFGSAVLLLSCTLFFIGRMVSLGGIVACLLILIMTFLVFLSIGMLSAGFIMVFKRGNPIAFFFGWSSFFLGGVFFPVEVLPEPISSLSQILPITHAVYAIREILLAGAAAATVFPVILILLVFIAVFAPLGIVFFRFAVNRAKSEGSLIHY
jgi:ABC-2 type transport system permease protein